MVGPNGEPADTSAILTCYNESAYILDALTSVLSQTAAERLREVIVVDDGSTDDSARLIGEFAEDHPKVKLIQSTNVGLPAARNLALAHATGSYVAVLDGDDLWCAQKLELQLPVLDENPTVGLVYSDYYEFDDGRPIDSERCFARGYHKGHRNLLADYYVYDAPVIPSCMVVRKAAFDEVGAFNPELRVGEDTEMCLRIAERYEFHHIAEPLIHKRRHPRSISSRQDRLWPNQLRVTEEFAERNPELRPMVKRRLSRRAAKVGWGMVQIGERRLAAKYLIRALRYDPRQMRTFVYALLACLPRSVALKAHRHLAELRGMSKTDNA
jgi:glycosyltransferase involved in cell wall biosynthesis